MNKNKIREEVVSWNNRFPIDRWWRDKYKIPFMSKVHREASFLDQLFEYEEERLVNEVIQEQLEEIKKENNKPISEQIKEMEQEFDQFLKERGED